MGLFGIGGSKASSSSFQQSTTASDSVSRSRDRIAFDKAFSHTAFGAVNARNQADVGGFSEAAQELFSGGTKFLERLEGGAGVDFLESRITGDSGIADQRIQNLSEDLGRFFREELLTGISRTATGTGTQGGSRQGVAESLAAREVAQQFTRGATQIRGDELDARTAAAESLTGLQTERAATGVAALDPLLNIEERGTFADVDSYQRVSDIIGAPTVLNRTTSRANTRAKSYGRSTSDDISADFSFL